MTQSIEFGGQVHEFPDSFTQSDIASALSAYQPPSVAKDVGKQLLSSVPLAMEGAMAATPSLMGLAAGGVESLVRNYLPGVHEFFGGDEAMKERQNRMAAIDTVRKGGITQYLPKAETTAGEYARTVPQFTLQAAAMPGNIVRNVVGGTAAGLAGETARQATAGTEAEPYALAGGALIGGIAGLRGAEAIAARQAAKAAPTTAAIKSDASATYDALTTRNVATPIAQAELDSLASDLRSTLNAKGIRPSTASQVHAAINEIETPATKGAADVADLVAARQSIKGLLGSPDANKAGAAIALPKVEAAIERLSPGTMKQIREADKNWAAVKANEALDKRMARADLRSAGEHSGLNLGNRIRQNVTNYLLSNESKYLSPENKAVLEKVVRGTTTQNSLRLVSNLLGGGGGLGSTLLGAAGAAGGTYSGHPELAALPLGGIGLRMLSNRLTAGQAANAAAAIRARSPYAQAQGIATPVPRLSRQEAGLLGALYSVPASRGILQLQ